MLLLLSLLLGGPVLAWVRTVYTRLSGTNDRAPFRPERTGNFPVAADETAADMLCCALYPLTDLHLVWGASLQVQRRGPVMAKTPTATPTALHASKTVSEVCPQDVRKRARLEGSGTPD